MMREKSRARRRVRTRVALFLSLASLAGLYLSRLLGAALHAAGLSAVALSTAGTLLCFLLPALAGLFLLDGDQRGLIALRALSAQHVLCLAAAGALADGVTRLVNVPQARVKETDRIAVMNSELTRMGAEIEELPDGMVIRGSRLHGARVSSHGDHRIAMALAVAALAADGVTEIDGAEAASVTYPDFVRDFQKLGADFTLVP